MGKFKNVLIVEGGGMRGIFSAGVLDSFLLEKFDPFDTYIGVSAGACNLSSHLAGQKFRNYRAYMYQMATSGFVNPKEFARGGHLMNLDWLLQKLEEVDPFDVSAAARYLLQKKKRFLIVATNITSGQPDYLRPTKKNWIDCLKASCAVPILYRNTPMVNGQPYLDGGVSDPIPVDFAISKGARNILLVRSRPIDYVKKPGGFETRVGSFLFRKEPHLQQMIKKQPVLYQKSLDFIKTYQGSTSILQVAPAEPLQSGRTTKNARKLQSDYNKGRQLGSAIISKWSKSQ